MQDTQSIIDDLIANPIEETGHIYHPIPFDEFDQLTTSSKAESAYKKWDLLTAALPEKDFHQFRILDIGANAGFYSYQFAKRGATVDAFEPRAEYAQLGQKVSAIYDLPVHWYPQPFAESFLNDHNNYDVALMLSVFQWMSEGNAKLDSATETLRAVAHNTRYLFFELGCNGGKSSIQTKGSGLRWIWKFLNQNTDYATIAYLGSVRAWSFRDVRHQFVCTSDILALTAWQQSVTKLLQIS